jgi:hypothetical protein
MFRNEIARSVAVFVAIGAAILTWWYAAYDRSDPNSVQYFLWKQGYQTEDMRSAIAAMYDDPNASAFVEGKTPDELRKWFPLVSFEDASRSSRTWYEASDWVGRKVMFVPDSLLMIVFDDNNRATSVVFMGA